MSFNDSFRNLYAGFYQEPKGLVALAEAQARGQDKIVLGKQLITYGDFQKSIRPFYGKPGTKEPAIGTHPDFSHINSSAGEKFYAVTLFMDIENSTRLGILYSPEDVFRIKNAFICSAIEIISAFDGHVHRIMGDAVMAFFGGKSVKSEDAIADSLNCASMLRFLVETVVTPFLQEHGYEGIGIRIGIDYGPPDKVLWSQYGFPGVSEITTTSYYVDVAAKLQQQARKNCIMIGQNLKEFIDFPEELLSVKTYISDGQEKPEYYVYPNFSIEDGNSKLNYRKWELNWNKYLKYSPVNHMNAFFQDSDGISYLPVSIKISNEMDTNNYTSFYSSSFFLQKDKYISFKPKMSYIPRLPYRYKFQVYNHGKEAANENCLTKTPVYVEIDTEAKHRSYEYLDGTRYRGLHFLEVEVVVDSRVIHKAKVGVYIL